MKLLILALSVVSLRADSPATCLAGSDGADGGNTAETNENCTARGITDAITCDQEESGLVCTYTPAVCEDDGNACTTNTDTNGVCVAANVADATPCNDGDDGTEEDVCTSGSCAGTAIPTYGTDATCLAGSDGADGGNTAETNENCTARGITEALCDAEGTGLVCAWMAASCTDTGDACTESVAVDGVCGAPAAVAEATPCDDGSEETENDVCTSGVCGGTPTEAPVPAPVDVSATCLAGSDGADGGNTAETDENCTARGLTEALCQSEGDALVCAYTAAVCVDDGNVCTTNTATDGVCSGPVNVDDDTSCDDANDDTTNDVCASGVCVGGDTTPTNNTGSEAGTPSPSGDEQTSSASHAQVFAALASAFLLL